jgi:hypothetical protein
LLGGCHAGTTETKAPFSPWLSIRRSEGEQEVLLYLERGADEPVLRFRSTTAVVEFRDDGLVAVRLKGFRGATSASATYEAEQTSWIFRPESDELSIVLGTGVLEFSDRAGHTAEFMDAETWGVLTGDPTR